MHNSLPSKSELLRRRARTLEREALELRRLATKYRSREDYDLEAWCYAQSKYLMVESGRLLTRDES